MKKERIEILKDSFVNEKGELRYFVIAACSRVLSEETLVFERYSENYCKDYEDEVDELLSGLNNLDNEYSSEENYAEIDKVVKGVYLGISICNPSDNYNEDLGVKIAVGRSKKNKIAAFYSTQLGYINTTVVRALLEQEAKYLKENPERYIASYKR